MSFTAFVLVTLSIELAISAMLILGFYAAVASWSAWRSGYVVDHYRLTSGPALFCIGMLAIIAASVWMIIITGVTALMIKTGAVPQMLASTYNLSYNSYAYVAAGITMLELLTIFTDKIPGVNSAMGSRAADIVGTVYRRKGILCHQRATETGA